MKEAGMVFLVLDNINIKVQPFTCHLINSCVLYVENFLEKNPSQCDIINSFAFI